MKANIKVHICDDHQMMIDGLKLLLSNCDNVSVIGDSKNGVELLKWYETNNADVVLLDINMPEMDGITACKELSQIDKSVKIIFLSMINQTSIIHSLIESGAKGYLLKNSGHDELEEAITKVYNGGVYFDEKVFSINTKKPKSISSNLKPKLTKRELEVLELIVREYTSSEISTKLFIGLGTVETHRRNLISKMGVKNTAGLVRVAMEYKLVN